MDTGSLGMVGDDDGAFGLRPEAIARRIRAAWDLTAPLILVQGRRPPPDAATPPPIAAATAADDDATTHVADSVRTRWGDWERALRCDVRRGLDPRCEGDFGARRRWFGPNHHLELGGCSAPTGFIPGRERRRHHRRRGLGRVLLGALGRHPWLLLAALGTTGVLIAFLAMGIGDFVEELVSNAAVVALLGAILVLRAYQEWTHQGLIDELHAVRENHAVRGRRAGGVVELRRWDLVVGDLVELAAGDLVPADGAVVHGDAFEVDEGIATGETAAVPKTEGMVLLSDTIVTHGIGTMLVLAVGPYTHQSMGTWATPPTTTTVSASMTMPTVFDDHRTTVSDQHALPSPVDYTVLKTPAPSSSPVTACKKSPDIALSKGRWWTRCRRHGPRPDDEINKSHFAHRLDRYEKRCHQWGVVIGVGYVTIRSLLYTNVHIQQVIWFAVQGVLVALLLSPDALAVVLYVTRSISLRRLRLRGVLARRHDAPEGLADCTILCVDKTGTLTTNDGQVSRIWVGGVMTTVATTTTEPQQRLLVPAQPGDLASIVRNRIVQCIQATMPRHSIDNVFVSSCNLRVSSALNELVRQMELQDPSLQVIPPMVVRRIAFTSSRRCGSVVARATSTGTSSCSLFVVGAPERILHDAKRVCLSNGSTIGLDEATRLDIESSVIAPVTLDGGRLLCLAYREIDPESADFYNVDLSLVESSFLETDLTLLAVVVLSDSVRPEAPQMIAQCKEAGLRVCMVTGDHHSTAVAVARECGILSKELDDVESATADGTTMDAMVFRERVMDHRGEIIQSEFDRVWPRLRVLSRATPMDKSLLVRGLMSSVATEYGRQLAAFVGDGPNDVAALMGAHVGITFGRSGASVAKRAADLVLLDDKLSSLILPMSAGTHVRISVTAFVEYHVTLVIVTLILTIILYVDGSVWNLTEMEVLWVNLVMSCFLALGLSYHAPDYKAIYMRNWNISASLIPRRRRVRIIGLCLYQLAVLGGLFPFVVARGLEEVLADFSLQLHGKDWPQPRPVFPMQYPIIFNTLVWMQLFQQLQVHASVTRMSHGKGLLVRLIQGRVFVACWLIQAAIQVVLIEYGSPLGIQSLPSVIWLISLVAAAIPLLIAQIWACVVGIGLPRMSTRANERCTKFSTTSI